MELARALYDVNQEHRICAASGEQESFLPATPLHQLGDAAFRRAHGLTFNYVGGAMANGIASVELVFALARAGFLGIYGAAGLDVATVEAAIIRLAAALGEENLPYGINLIHSPGEPALEMRLVELFFRRQITLIEASAFLKLTPAVVLFRAKGLRRNEDGQVEARHKVIAKVSRVEVARAFLSPAPDVLLQELVANGALTAEEAALAKEIPVAEDVTAEADSGGHTDNRSAITLIPTMLALRDEIQLAHGYAQRPRIGAAGGIATPEGAAAAFAMGAAYIVTGTVNQACVESGTSDLVRGMLAGAKQADCAMAPAADMFEMGVKVQVLKHGTMFPMRAAKLFELYSKFPSLEALPDAERAALEKTWFRAPLTAVWASTKAYFAGRDPAQIERAERDPKHKMALVFRSYLGQSSHWANRGEEGRKFDFQVWCGPAMGAFNEWAKGSHLEPAAGRSAANIGFNLLAGAAVTLRRAFLRVQGVEAETRLPPFRPLTDAQLVNFLPEKFAREKFILNAVPSAENIFARPLGKTNEGAHAAN